MKKMIWNNLQIIGEMTYSELKREIKLEVGFIKNQINLKEDFKVFL